MAELIHGLEISSGNGGECQAAVENLLDFQIPSSISAAEEVYSLELMEQRVS